MTASFFYGIYFMASLTANFKEFLLTLENKNWNAEIRSK